MAGIVVDDPTDPRLADYVQLTDVKLRTSMEAAHGLFMAEGEKVIRRAIAAGYGVRSMLVTPERLAGLADVAGAGGGPVYVISHEVAERVTGYRVHRGALASMNRRALPSVAGVLQGRGQVRAAVNTASPGGWPDREPDPPRRIVVLEDLVDHGNVGGIFRCAAALGVDAVILSPRCADPLYRRAIKVSMGAVFAIPYARMTNWRAGLAEIRAAGFAVLALTPDQSAVALDDVPMPGRVALLLGTEGDGLSSRWLDQADHPVCIPMSAGAMALGVDSLNVVAAAAIACHGLARVSGPEAAARRTPDRARSGVLPRARRGEELAGLPPPQQHDCREADQPGQQRDEGPDRRARAGETEHQEEGVKPEEHGRYDARPAVPSPVHHGHQDPQTDADQPRHHR
jgi:tRNA G18 (ribose-2'-O)-methylase SpoU